MTPLNAEPLQAFLVHRRGEWQLCLWTTSNNHSWIVGAKNPANKPFFLGAAHA